MKISNAKLDAASNQWLTAFQTALAQSLELGLITAGEKAEFERIAHSHRARMDTLHRDLHKAEKRGRWRQRHPELHDQEKRSAPAMARTDAEKTEARSP